MNRENLTIEILFQEKLMLYGELVAVLKEEKKWILNADVEALWRMSARKRAVVDSIEKVRAKILSELDQMGIAHDMTPRNLKVSDVMALLPMEQRKKLAGISPSLAKLKEEIRTLSIDNRRYIDSGLSVLDDLMSILTGMDRPPVCYPGRKPVTSEAPRLLHREV